MAFCLMTCKDLTTPLDSLLAHLSELYCTLEIGAHRFIIHTAIHIHRSYPEGSTGMRRPFLSTLIVFALFGTLLAACGTSAPAAPTTARPLIISAIPDQAPEKLTQIYTKLATYLSTELGMPVEYKPVADYTA